MCGEHAESTGVVCCPLGSSPHVRGARCRAVRAVHPHGIIPACAGSTSSTSNWTCGSRDHPRMCGEHPHMPRNKSSSEGSSPHVRGARVPSVMSRVRHGIIPACAGSTSSGHVLERTYRDHPRMCGEHPFQDLRVMTAVGSSPHVRGARYQSVRLVTELGIIPACAGSTPAKTLSSAQRGDHPRMCGEHILAVSSAEALEGSSPHVRGAPFENSIIPRKRKDNWLFSIQFRFENFLAFRYLLALLHPFLGVPTKDPSFASLGRLINCNPSQSTGDQSAPYTLKAICCSFLAE